MWAKLLASIPDQEQRRLMPRHSDVYDLPAIAAMLYEDHATIPVTEERWLAVVDSVDSQVKMWQAEVRHDLLLLLKSAKNLPPHWFLTPALKPQAVDVTGDEVDFSVIDKASSLFRCGTYGCKDLFGHAAIFDHRHFHNRKWVDILSRLQCEAGTELVVAAVLKNLNLPEDTSLAAMEQLNGRLICLCGHRNSTTFGELVCLILMLLCFTHSR